MTENQAGQQDVLVPTTVWRPGASTVHPTAAATTAAGSGRYGGATIDPFGRTTEPPLPPPSPLVASVGDIAGLRPRRRPRDGGEVPGADVDLIDALPRDDDPTTGQRAGWPTVAAWLRAGKTATTRRARLAAVAKFVRWWARTAPGAGLWQATEDVMVAYLDQVGTGSGPAAHLNRGGKALAPATLAWHLANLKSLYGYAARRRVIDHSPAQWVEAPEVGKVGTTPALALPEGTALLRGAQAIAAEHPADAAAVALLAITGMRAGELENLTVGRIERTAGHWVIRFRLKGGAVIVVPLPQVLMALLRPLQAGRRPNDLLLQRTDGRSFDRWRQQTALRRAARAAGLEVAKLTPHMLRATAATLLLAIGVPVEDVQKLLGHASPVTTQRYDRGETQLDEHAVHRLADLLTQQPPPAPDRATDDAARAQQHDPSGHDPGSSADSAQEDRAQKIPR
ncbi:MAG: tyrosine-type recombinase/integrase [Streptomyces sp.]|nr:tyrosine-type recombinase/integrase [Streptomyces sp.]